MNEFSYSGIPEEYKATIGNARFSRPIERSRANADYYDLNSLQRMLAQLITETGNIKEEAAVALANFNLSVQPQTRLYEAQTQVARQAETTPDHVSFLEYNTISSQNHRAARYVKSEYEYTMRGPSGSNAMDVYLIASIINQEARNIDRFLTQYLGDVNDSSEYRTIELFQDWAKPAFQHTGALRYFLAERDKARNTIAKSELAQIDSEKSKQYQAIFQAKLNVVNTQYQTSYDAFANEFTYLSNVFYDKVLGPAVYFRTRVMKKVEPTVAQEVKKTVLGKEVLSAQAALNANMAGNIADHNRRNQIYQQRITRLFQLLQSRSAYRVYIDQLSDKGSSLTAPFKQESEVAPIPTSVFDPDEEDTNTYLSPHSKLDGIGDDDAHSQYLLRDGGSILGDVWVKEGIKIAGVDIPAHTHRGVDVDGTPQISGADIEEGTLYSELVASEHTGAQPKSLNVDQQTVRNKQGVVQVDTTLSWKQKPNEQFELQIVPLNSLTEPPPSVFDDIYHSHIFNHFTTEDSNFLSHQSVLSETMITTDANLEQTIYDTPKSVTVPFITEAETEFRTGIDCLEIGTDLYFVSPKVGVVKTALMSSIEEIIYPNKVEIYGDVKHLNQVANLCYSTTKGKMYWFDLTYSQRDGETTDFRSSLISYDIATKATEIVGTYLTYVDYTLNQNYLFSPTFSAIYYEGYIYACCYEAEVDEVTGQLFWPDPVVPSFRKFDVETGEMTKTDLEVWVRCPFYLEGEVMFLTNNPAELVYEDGEDDESERYRRIYQMIDTDSEITVIPHNLDGLFNEDYELLSVTADVYNNIYGNLLIPTEDWIDGNPFMIVKCEIDDE